MDWRFYNCIYAISCIAVFCGFSHGAQECTRACRLKESNEECWAQSLDFYTTSMFEVVDRYAATLLYLARWQHEHNDTQPGQVDVLKNNSLSRMLKGYLPKEDSANPLDKGDLQAIIQVIQQRVFHLEPTYISEEKLMPHFLCPIPCGYDSQIWFYISILLFVILILSCLAFFLFYRQQFLSRPSHRLLLKER